MSVQESKITVRLVGSDEDRGKVRFDEFRRFFNRLADCLRVTESIVTSEHNKIHYRVAKLQNASAGVTLEALPPKKGEDRRTEVIGVFRQTLANLEAGTPIDKRFSIDALRAFRSLRDGLRKTKEVWIDGEQITSQYIANIDKILETTMSSKGLVSGRLERLNVHNKNEFVLYPPISGHYVTCQFDDDLFEKVRDAIKRNVTVFGTLYYSPDKPFPTRVQVESLEVHPPDECLPKLAELKGSLKGCLNDMKAVDFVRAIRDEQKD